MPISMDSSARYVTQSSAYDRLLVGKPMTNRTITKRKKQGYYGTNGILFQSKEKAKRKRGKSILTDLLKDFNL